MLDKIERLKLDINIQISGGEYARKSIGYRMFNVDEKVFLFRGGYIFFSATFKTTAKLTIVCNVYRTLEK